jgi:hypothetical protein
VSGSAKEEDSSWLMDFVFVGEVTMLYGGDVVADELAESC